MSKEKYILEIADDKNRGVIFGPLGVRLRGRWDSAKVAKFQHSESSSLGALYERVPVIPGMFVWIDLDKKAAGAFDPLEKTDNGRKLMDSIRNHYQKNESTVVRPADEIQIENMNPDQIKDFLYWMRRILDDQKAVVVIGSSELPSLDAIKKMPGKRTLNHGWPAVDKDTRAIEEQYEFAVPVSGSTAAAKST